MRIVAIVFGSLLPSLFVAGCNNPANPSTGDGTSLKGDKGDPGDPGAKGEPGAMGIKGDPGTPGAKGDAGPVGATGATGAAGAAGPKGDPGMPGAKGDPGPAGSAGPKGDAGPTGSAGPAGPKGDTGATGPKGDQGPQGPTGPAGSGAYGEDLGGFAGFTSATYGGAITGGRPGAHAICAAAFAGSHLCHAAEYIQSNSGATPPSSGAWLDPSLSENTSDAYNNGMASSGRYVSYSGTCDSWSTTASGYNGTYVTATAGIANNACSGTRALACCNTTSKTRFAGFTSATTSGSAGGRHKMHALCASAFAGSHLCHATEYVRANSASAVPSTGAWLDPSLAPGGSSVWNTGMPSSGRYIGYSGTCDSWSTAASGYNGTYVGVNGDISNNACASTRALACCF